jgi:hypothetical protein
MSHQNPIKPQAARSRLDHLVNLPYFYDGVDRYRRTFGFALGTAFIGHSAGAAALRGLRRNWHQEWWMQPEPWWWLGSVLLVSRDP